MSTMSSTSTMTSDGKRALAKTIRALRTRLIGDLGEATERVYRLSVVDAKKAQLDEAARVKRGRLEGWIDEQVRALPQTGTKANATAGAAERSRNGANQRTLESAANPAERSRNGANQRTLESAARLRDDVVKDAAATLLLRIVYLRLLEASGLSAVKVVTGGWDSRGYKDFREAAPELIRADETEGYAALLALMFDELALDLPGLYGPVRMTSLVPVPAATLRAVVDALDDEALASVWNDDTTLGWIYQYWNDPEREALDAKLAASKKLENHEIASKTQMFTERYMVEWLLHNTLGQMWLAMCQRHGWVARVRQPLGQPGGASDAGSSAGSGTSDRERDGAGTSAGDGAQHGANERTLGAGPTPCLLDQLDTRRAEWRKLRELGPKHEANERTLGAGPDHGGVALDALMPIEPGLENRWKYWVPQPMPEDAVTSAPASVRELKLLDPACGSGHFLVIAFELLFHLYQEEAALRGQAGQPGWTDRDIVESILEYNLHGIDIDPKAVQIAAAALMLKARQLCATAQPRVMNLVAPALSLASLADGDPALRELHAAVQAETGIPPELTASIVSGLAGADHLGTLLRVDRAIDEAIESYGEQLSKAVPTKADQGGLFTGFAPRQRKAIDAELAKAAVLDRLEGFLAQHSGGADLGLRLRGEQLAAGVRFVRLVREGQYDIVVGNPPYQGTSKMADKAYVEKQYPRGKADLYAAFLERGLQLAKPGGVSALLTMRNWMFIKQFSALREWLLATYDLRMLGDVDRGAFDEVPNEVLAAVMSVFRSAPPSDAPSVAMQPTPLDDKSYDRERTKRKRAALLCQVGRFEFIGQELAGVTGAPLVYWWNQQRLIMFKNSPTLGSVSTTATAQSTGDNTKYRRNPWEIPAQQQGIRWFPYVGGADGTAWIEPVRLYLNWQTSGLEIKLCKSVQQNRDAFTLASEDQFFKVGVTFPKIGHVFSARAFAVPSIFGDAAPTIFPPNIDDCVCLLNSSFARSVLADLNPSVNFGIDDVERLPLQVVHSAASIMDIVRTSFVNHERHRETSIDFRKAGGSNWQGTMAWAQLAVDRPDGAPLPPYEPVYDAEPPTDHLSFAIGVALGRFGAAGEGILSDAPATALPHGILFLSDASDDDSLAHPAAAPILAAWATHGVAIDDKRSLKNYLQDKFFPDVHRKMYENRPIYFPLSSAKKAFVAYVSIHRWTAGTLNHLLAELENAKRKLEGEITDLRAARDGTDKKASKAADKRFGDVGKWLEELSDFITSVEQCAERGPPPPDNKTTPRAADARYAPDLDDGVMINSAALWPLLDPQWKDPKKWWRELANADGKKDYDWAHLAARYFPDRVDAKCKTDPSLAVAHGCFWKYHPAKAYQWELRLQDEIRPDFTLDESDSAAPATTTAKAVTTKAVTTTTSTAASDRARAAFERDHPETVQELVTKEHLRRVRKLIKATTTGTAGDTAEPGDDDDAPQGSLDLTEPNDED